MSDTPTTEAVRITPNPSLPDDAETVAVLHWADTGRGVAVDALAGMELGPGIHNITARVRYENGRWERKVYREGFPAPKGWEPIPPSGIRPLPAEPR